MFVWKADPHLIPWLFGYSSLPPSLPPLPPPSIHPDSLSVYESHISHFPGCASCENICLKSLHSAITPAHFSSFSIYYEVDGFDSGGSNSHSKILLVRHPATSPNALSYGGPHSHMESFYIEALAAFLAPALSIMSNLHPSCP